MKFSKKKEEGEETKRARRLLVIYCSSMKCDRNVLGRDGFFFSTCRDHTVCALPACAPLKGLLFLLLFLCLVFQYCSQQRTQNRKAVAATMLKINFIMAPFFFAVVKEKVSERLVKC
jgi:hypothetical protein